MLLLGAIFLFTTQAFAAAAVLGVDLGTEYIKAALVKPGIPLEIVLTKDSRRKETSAVAFKPSKGEVKDGEFPERAYGADAMALSARFPGEVYPNLKTLLGLPTSDPAVIEYAARHPALQLETHPVAGTAAFKTKTLTAEEEAWMVEELLAMELQSVQKNAQLTAGDGVAVRSVVLTIPPFYTTDEKRAVLSAADLAGLKVLSLVSDGLAVGLNYATSRQFPNINEGEKPEYHMVFDMGAGSAKATVMKFNSRVVKDVGKYNKTVQEVQVLGTGWERGLGGDALNYLILDDMISQFVQSKAAQKISATEEGVKKHGRAMAKLLKEAERLRHVLSANQNTQASFEGLYEDVDFKYKISRADFEKLAEGQVTLVGSAIQKALTVAGMDIVDLTSVILHGGATRTPFVQKALEGVVGSADKIRSNVNSDEAAVFGAGFRAADLSPSFRVKEIRVSEGAGYSSGIKWTGAKDKEQRQRLFSAVSPQGGVPKEVTINEIEDFSGTFWQSVNDADVTLKSFSVKNLTASVAELKEKYSSCSDSDITFKVGIKLSSDSGEVEVAKATIECEAEFTEKEGILGAAKNLFGFGKKDEKPLKDGESASSEKGSEETLKEKAAGSSDADASSTAPAAEASGEAKDVKKTELVIIPIKIEIESAGRAQLSKTDVTKSKDRLKSFATSDKARIAREEALNQLEGYTYKVRDLLDGESFIEKSTEAERTKLSELASAASDWLYEDGAEATKDVLKAKLKELHDIAKPVEKRIEEALNRPTELAALKDALNQTSNFLGNIRSQIAVYDAYLSSSSSAAATATSTSDAPAEEATGDFDGLEDEDSSDEKKDKEEKKKDEGPLAPIYKLEDLTDIEKLAESTLEWLKEQEAAQALLALNVNPVLLIKDLKEKKDKLDKAGMDLAIKGSRNLTKDKKKAKESKKAAKKSKSASATSTASDGEPTILTGDDIEDMFTEEQIEQMIKQAKEKMEKDKKEGAKHDEL